MAKGDMFRPGETVFYSFQVAGYGQSPVKAVRLSYKVEAFDPKGIRIEAPVESIYDATLRDEDKQWMPKLRVPVGIPPSAPPGIYKIKTLVTDDISHLTASVETEFEVEGRAVLPSPELAIRNFAFHRSAENAQPLETAAYRAGDTMFATFDIAGFRYASENTVDVSYDVAVLNPAGKQIYAQPRAAEDRSFSYYPKPSVPGQMSLNLQPNIRPGEYTVVVTAHDGVGNQQSEIKRPFAIE